MAQAHEAVDVEAFAVRPAVGDGVSHIAENDGRDGLAVQVENTGDTAHSYAFLATMVMPDSWTFMCSVLNLPGRKNL